MNWIQALKKWNTETNTGKWKIPKKGSTEYNQVKSLMGPSAKKETTTKPKRKYTKKPKATNIDITV